MNEESVPPPGPEPASAAGSDADPRPGTQAAAGPDAQDDVPDAQDHGPEAQDDVPAGYRRLTRSQDGRLITGVCAGLARYTRIDAIVFRVGFALLVIATGLGILLYIAAFLLMGAPDGGPSRIEKAGKRVFDGDTALVLLGATLAVLVVFNIVGNWGSGDSLAVVVVLGLTLLVARSRGVDLVQVARGLPDRIKGRPLSSWTPSTPAPATSRQSDGMIDLARLGRRTDAYATGTYAPGLHTPGPGPHTTGPHTPDPHTTGPYAGTPPVPGPNPTPPYPPTGTDDPYGRYPTDPYGTNPYAKGPYAADNAPPYLPRPHRRSYLTSLTLLFAALVAAVLYNAVDDRPNLTWLQIVIAGALAVVAVGLFLGAWFGRDRKLVLVGAIMSFALASTSIAGNAAVARKTHHMMWRPAATAQAEQSHKVLVGQGLVDLTTVPLSPGQRLQVSAEVMLGVLAVKVPATARLEVDGHAYIGDITVDRQVTSGPGARVNRVLEPEAQMPGGTPTIVLHLRSKVGDMEITRVPA
jgi:phage shock protein PspC (stress-responsive transcriptional regulator)